MINLWSLSLAFFLVYCFLYIKNWKLYKALRKFPGPIPLPILGNSLNFALSSHGIFQKFNEFSNKYKRFFRVWNNGKPYVIINEHKDVEVLLGSNVHLCKNEAYKNLIPWIGYGLISISDINKWRKHRKIITPTFHFKILNDFFEIFVQNADLLCHVLEAKIGKGPFDIHGPVKQAALDNICETAMGIKMNSLKNPENAYIKAVQAITEVVTLRMFKVWLMIDFLFNVSKYAKVQENALKILHGTTDKMIGDARKKYQEMKKIGSETEPNSAVGEKKKLAFLHLLLKSEEGSQLSDTAIRQEVDTFMFAGHDTISSGISFTLYCLAENPDVQKLACKEQSDLFGNSNRFPTLADIQEMKYLDRVIKEAQRLYPSVPFIGRELFEDLELPGNYVVPRGTQLCINIFALHHDPKVWSNPYEFNPDNFLPEAVQSRHPYAFVPFSAGPRNCIGQKYAMLAMKVTLSMLLRRYKIFPSPYFKDKPQLAGEIVLLSSNGIHICIEKRL